MRLKPARLQYALLILLTAFSLAFNLQGVGAVLDLVLHRDEVAEQPVQFDHGLDRVSGVTSEAYSAGLRAKSRVLTINGRRFTAYRVLVEEMRRSHVGETMRIVYTDGDSVARTAYVGLVPAMPLSRGWFYILGQYVLLRILFPLLCVGLGVWVVLAKPQDLNAWLLLGIFNYFPTNLLSSYYSASPWLLAVAPQWSDVANTLGPVCIMLFSLYFPQRSPLEQNCPWLKWLVVVPSIGLLAVNMIFTCGVTFNFASVGWLAPRMFPISWLANLLAFLAITVFFVSLPMSVAETTAPDARRRLRIMYIGSQVGCAPIAILALLSLVRNRSITDGVPVWISISAVSLFTLFPITLAYVVVVQRAMDVRILIRQGTKYAFARTTLWVVSALLAALLAYSIGTFIQHPRNRRSVEVVRILGIVGAFLLFRFRASGRLQRRIDQRFFREAYSTEQLLSELSDEARSFTEVAPLIETIAQRLGETLHVDRIAVFLRHGESFRLELAAGMAMPPGGFALPAGSTMMTALARAKGPANVYRDDPASWLVEATDAERAGLYDLSTELLVPVPGRNRLIGAIALGPKRSEEPYSRTDRQLLQSVASQTGLALENAELLENLKGEIAQRERVSREIEIAREVQERLFPQSYPTVAGVDMAGYCRPAQAVGGDYYDFFVVPAAGGDRLAIALGDISGKGISAALLMASLRASLRSVAMLQAAHGDSDLAALMGHVNRLVYEGSSANRYATFFYAEFDARTMELRYVNAGHNSPVVLRGATATALEATGMVVGLLPWATYEQANVWIGPGDVLLAFTDGISEAMTVDDEEWGEERLIACAQRLRAEGVGSARGLVERLMAAADAFAAGAAQNDDMTIVVCGFSPGEPSVRVPA